MSNSWLDCRKRGLGGQGHIYELRERVKGGLGVRFKLRPYLHLCEPERVLPACPTGPLHAIRVGGVASSQVLPIEVRCVAVPIPPRPLIIRCAVVL